MQIREAAFDDLTHAGEIAVAAYAAVYDRSLGSYADSLRDAQRRAKEAVLLVAVEADEVVGTVTYVGEASSPYAEDQRDGEASIRMLAVAPAHARRGIGRALSLACIERARTEGKHAIVLHADEIMNASRALYESLGFGRDPARDFAPDDQTSLLCYRLELSLSTSRS